MTWDLFQILTFTPAAALAAGIVYGLFFESAVVMLRWALKSVHLMITGVQSSEVMD